MVVCTSAKIPLWGTSDMLGTLGDIVEWEHEEERSHHWMDCQQI
jgi:hypothetical protein